MGYQNGGQIVNNGLVLSLDTADRNSFISGSLSYKDLSGNNNNATLTSNASYDSDYLGSILFDGSSSYVNVTETANMTPQILTIDTAFRVNSNLNILYQGAPTNYQFIFFRQNTRTSNYEGYIGVYVENEQRIFVATTTSGGVQSTVYSTSGSIPFGTTANVTVVIENTLTSIYLNGVLNASGSKNAGIDYNATHTLKLGRAVGVGSNFDAAFNGEIYYYRMYNRALTASEIAKNYVISSKRFLNTVPSIVTNGLFLNLDASTTASYIGSGSAWNDLSGNGYNGTLINGPTFNYTNQGMIEFDGSNDYAIFNNLPTTSVLTLSCWVTLIGSNPGSEQIVLMKTTSGSTSPSYRIAVSPADLSTYAFAFDGTTTQNLKFNQTGTDTPFINLVAVFNSTNSAVYLNGVLKNTGSLISVNAGTSLSISANTTGGTIKQSKFAKILAYNRALSDSEVLQNYNATKGRFGL